MSEFVWEPPADVIARANVTRLAAAHGLASFDELVARSIDDIEWYWDAAVKDLGIEFDRPYTKVLDTSDGVEWAKWFVDGRINIAQACVHRHRGPNRAVVWESEDGTTRTLIYEELSDEVYAFAAHLASLGVGRGDAVGMFLPMTPAAVVTLMACCHLGALVIPIFSGFAAPAIAARLNDAKAKVLVHATSFNRRGNPVDMAAVAAEARSLSPTVEHLVDANAVRATGTVPVADTASEDPFMIAYTSGTTGKPKGSVHVHGGFLVKIASEVAYQTDYQPGELLFWFSDPGWIMGPWEIVGTLALGGTVFLYDGAPDFPAPDRLWDMIERHKINILGVSPSLVRALAPLGDEHVTKHDLSSLRVLGSTGEPWNTEPYLWFFNTVGGGRCPVMNFSGGTEVGACFLSPAVVMPLKACSLGGPSLGMAVDVFGPDAKPIRGDVGELVCTKPWPGMTRGIWGDPQRYLDTYWSRWPGVWVHGDWASIDEDGQWLLHGRSDDTLNVAGKRVGPAEVESVLVEHPDVVEAAVVGVPDDVKGEAIWCYCVLTAGSEASDATATSIANHVAARLGGPFKPGAVRFVSQLPKTRNAKVLRRAVRAAALGLEQGDLSSLENPQALDEIASAG